MTDTTTPEVRDGAALRGYIDECLAKKRLDMMEAWLWLLGEDDLLAKVEDEDYGYYGGRQLAVVCEGMGFSIPEGAV